MLENKSTPFIQMSIKRGQTNGQRNDNDNDEDEDGFTPKYEEVPPPPPPPLLPKRTTSLHRNLSVNPKRVSIATSSFWANDPDLGHFGNLETMSSVWTEDECVNIWGDLPAVKKGIIILQQRDKLWPRWKERYCILTRDYLHCFRRTTSIHRSGVRLSEMGTFIFKIRLADIETVDWDMRKSGPIIAVRLPQDSRICLRTPSDTYEGLNQWYTLLAECVYLSKERRRALRNLHNGSTLDTFQSQRSNLSNRTCETQGSGGHRPSHSQTVSSDGSPNSSTKSTSMSRSSSKSSSDDSNASSTSNNNSSSSKENRHHNQKLIEGNGTMQSQPSQSQQQQLQQSQQKSQLLLKDHHPQSHQNSHSTHMSLRKNIGRMSISKLTPSNGKLDNLHHHHQQQQQYHPQLSTYVSDDDPDESDYDETEDQLRRFPYAIPNHNHNINNNKGGSRSRASIAVMSRHGDHHHPIGGIPSMTLNDFVRNPWRSNNKTASQITGISASCSNNNNPGEYSLPRDAVLPRNSRTKRPESWDTVHYRQPFMGKVNPSPSFSRGDSIYSRHTSDITFRKMT